MWTATDSWFEPLWQLVWKTQKLSRKIKTQNETTPYLKTCLQNTTHNTFHLKEKHWNFCEPAQALICFISLTKQLVKQSRLEHNRIFAKKIYNIKK